jgi:glycosyltransferase involved in cell wall biosynthesis
MNAAESKEKSEKQILRRVVRLFHTIKHLRWEQIVFRIWRRLYRPSIDRSISSVRRPLSGHWVPPVGKPVHLRQPWQFEFLHVRRDCSFWLDLLERLELFLYRRAALVVSVTHSFKANLVSRGIDGSKIFVVTNGVDGTRFRPQPKDTFLEKELELQGKFVAGYIGTHGMAHGLETLLEAANRLQKETDSSEIVFLFLGDGASKDSLVDRSKEMGLANVRFVDSVPKDQVTRYWSLLDVSIIHLKKTPLFTTVIPSKLFECMGMGIPVLHGVAVESAEIVFREGCGKAFEPENVEELCGLLRQLRSNPELLEEWRQKAIAAAKKYDRHHQALVMLAAFESFTECSMRDSRTQTSET